MTSPAPRRSVRRRTEDPASVRLILKAGGGAGAGHSGLRGDGRHPAARRMPPSSTGSGPMVRSRSHAGEPGPERRSRSHPPRPRGTRSAPDRRHAASRRMEVPQGPTVGLPRLRGHQLRLLPDGLMALSGHEPRRAHKIWTRNTRPHDSWTRDSWARDTPGRSSGIDPEAGVRVPTSPTLVPDMSAQCAVPIVACPRKHAPGARRCGGTGGRLVLSAGHSRRRSRRAGLC